MDDGIEHAGYLAFLTMLSIFPAMIFLFAIAASMGQQQTGNEFVEQLYNLLPDSVVGVIYPIIYQILSGPSTGLLTLAIIGIIWTASSMVEGTRTILNRVYRVKNPPHYLFRRGLSILQFIFFIFVLIIAMIFLTIVPGFIHIMENQFSHKFNFDPMVDYLTYYGSAVALFVAVASGYFILPNIKQNVVRVLPGAFICVVAWLVVIEFFTRYVGYYRQINIVYGSMGGIIITLVFFYVMAVIYIFGAEFNYLLEKELGHDIEERE